MTEIRTTHEDKVYTVNEVATIFRITPSVVRRLIKQGDLPAVRLGRIYRVPKAVVDQYFNLPARTHLTPEVLGFGIWREDEEVADSVTYVNQIRTAAHTTLRETLEGLDEWQS